MREKRKTKEQLNKELLEKEQELYFLNQKIVNTQSEIKTVELMIHSIKAKIRDSVKNSQSKK